VLEAGVEDIFDPAEFGAPDFAHLDRITAPCGRGSESRGSESRGSECGSEPRPKEAVAPSNARLTLTDLDNPGNPVDSVRNEYDVLQNPDGSALLGIRQWNGWSRSENQRTDTGLRRR
jgi:hypothetical protein